MVKRELKTLISDNNEASEVLNENGKRVSEDDTKDVKKRIKTKSLYRQPTAQELNRLQETENLFNSNLFRLQIDEIIQEVKLKEKTEKKVTEWYSQFKTFLLQIPKDNTEYDLSEQTLAKKLKVKLPISSELSTTKCMFKFHKFKNIEIIGSYALEYAINSKLTIDLQITAPAETYTKNDSVNYKYHKKQAAYLAYIASYLRSSNLIDHLNYTWLDSKTKVVLDIKPSGKLGKHATVRIYIACEPEAYKLHRFSPTRNNLRESWLFSTAETSEIGPPTPYYNSSVLFDLTASSNHELLNQTLSKRDNLKQAIILLKIWLRQRNLQISGHIVSLLVAYFVQIKRINNIMSSYQIVRNIWIALKSLDLSEKGISLYKGQDAPSLEEFHEHFPVVFIDITGYYNICWSMSKGTYDALKWESTLAVEMLDSSKINSFIPLFMTPVKPLMQFDHILKFKNPTQLKETILTKAHKNSRLNYGVDTLKLVSDSVHTLITRGLKNRAELVLQLEEVHHSWPINKKPDHSIEEKLSFGIILNPEHAMNTVEKGPPANLPEAEQFRSFWGDKSELRRFQDGSITETCVWRGDTAADRRTVTTQIIDYLFNHKYEIPPTSLFHISNQLECVLARRQYRGEGGELLYVEECSATVVHAFDDLRRDLRQLTELPLDINAVYGVSSVFSYTCPLPAVRRAAPRAPWRRGGTCLLRAPRPDAPASMPEYTPVCTAVVELGHSGKWPGDLEAFRCLKAAFHLQIAERLTKQYSLATHPYPTHVDVIKNGIVFRLRIAHSKEITLLRKIVENGVAKYRDTEESVAMERETVILPRIRGALHGLHQKYPSFGGTVCLFKRWLSSHLLSPPHFPSTMAELVVARVFVKSEPAHPPTSPTVGLVRVLESLVNTDWDTEVIVLDFNDDLSREDVTSLEQRVSTVSPRPSMCIVSTHDTCEVCPTVAVRTRVLTLARAALNYVARELEENRDDLLGLFIPSYSGYDVLIHLQPTLVPHAWERVDKKPTLRPLPTELAEDVIPVVDFHPVEKYLEELRSGYSEFALFFHDRYGGEVIAVLWKPDINDCKEFQVLNANALTPMQGEETKYKVNIPALIEDFKILGKGLVTEVVVNTD